MELRKFSGTPQERSRLLRPVSAGCQQSSQRIQSVHPVYFLFRFHIIEVSYEH
jgi:hypothetical protein